MSFRSARLAAGKTVAEVVKEFSVSDAAVYMWESGQTFPKGIRLKKIAEFYGCTVDELLNDDSLPQEDVR